MGSPEPGPQGISVILGFVLLIGVPVAFGLSSVRLFLYRHHVLQSMRDEVAVHMQEARWRVSLAYAQAGLAAALVTTVISFALARSEFLLMRTAVMTLIYAWPVVLTTNAIAANRRHTAIVVAACYFVCFIAASVGLLLLNPTIAWSEPLSTWLLANALPTSLVWSARYRWVRAVGPFALAFVAASALAIAFAHGAAIDFAKTLLFALLLFGLAIEGVMVVCRRLYEWKALSDQSLKLDVIWLLFVSMQTGVLAAEHDLLGFFLGLLPFPIYLYVVSAALRRVKRDAPASSPRLLLVRFFALGDKSERLLEALATTWRYAGSVRAIADVELAPSSLKAQGFLDFISRKLDCRFITDSTLMASALASIDDAPDRDGRFRVNDYYCSSNTWPEAFSQLANDSDVVLIDLRSFGPNNCVCRLVLDQALSSLQPEHVVLLIDATTPQDFLVQFVERTQTQRRAKELARAKAQHRANEHESHPLASPITLSFSGDSEDEVDRLARVLSAASHAPAPCRPVLEAPLPVPLRLVGGTS
jgi:hypothetical protein